MSRADVLFWTYDWDAIVAMQREALRAKANGLSAEVLATASDADLAGALAEEFALRVPQIYPEELAIAAATAAGDPQRDFGLLRALAADCEVFQARLPFAGDPTMFQVRPLHHQPPPPPGRIDAGYVEIIMAGPGLTIDVVMNKARTWVAVVEAWLRRQDDSLGSYPDDLARLAAKAVAQRRCDLQTDFDLWADLEILRPAPRAQVR